LVIAFGRFGETTLDEAPRHFQKKLPPSVTPNEEEKMLPGRGFFHIAGTPSLGRRSPWSGLEILGKKPRASERKRTTPQPEGGICVSWS